jgi:hypothetical protein
MPESGGCERHRTDPFVNHLNAVSGSQFSHSACLDRLLRDSPQPEALYSDSESGAALVIERKTVVWSLGYAARHRNDHFIAEALSEQLRGVAEGRPLSIHLEPAPLMPQTELSAFVVEIVDSVTADVSAVLAGRTIGSTKVGRRWSCLLDPHEREACGEPDAGLIVRWTQPDELVSPDRLPADLGAHIRKLFESTVEKFRGYPQARGILLLDPYGAIRYTADWWWSRAFQAVPVPSEVAEVWLATYDWLTDFDQGWIFERVHPPREEGAA